MDIHVIEANDLDKLKNGDLVEFNGELWEEADDVKIPWSRTNYLVLRNVTTGKLLALRIVEGSINKMSNVDKRRMERNITSIVEQFSDNRERLIELAKRYYHNLAIHNRYDHQDVMMLMSLFPMDILEESGVAELLGENNG